MRFEYHGATRSERRNRITTCNRKASGKLLAPKTPTRPIGICIIRKAGFGSAKRTKNTRQIKLLRRTVFCRQPPRRVFHNNFLQNDKIRISLYFMLI